MITAAEARSNHSDTSKIVNSISNLIKTVSVGQSYVNISFRGDPENKFPDLTDSQVEVIQEALTKAGYRYEWMTGSPNNLWLTINW